MRSFETLSQDERKALEQLKTRLAQEFPGWGFRMTLFGSRARGDAEPDSDMDVLLELDTEKISFSEKQRIRRIAGHVSMETGIILSLLTVDRVLKWERGDFSIFQNIREEGIQV
jgi:predicted nucleotidyltransferase